MPNTNPAPLCQYDLPNGNRCRQVTLKREQFCRHHMRLFRHGAYQFAHDEAIERFSARLGQMNLRELLTIVHSKLRRIEKTIPVWDEARVAVTFAIDALCRKEEMDTLNGFARDLALRARNARHARGNHGKPQQNQ